LPDDWRVGKLVQVGKIICGKTPSKSNDDYFGNDIPFIKIPDLHNKMFILETTDNLSIEGAMSQNNKMLPKDSICISCIATVGLVSITTKDSQTNQQINSIIPNNQIYREYLYFTLTKMNDYLNDLGSGGTATLNVNTSTFSNIELVIPSENNLKEFHQISNPIFEKVLKNNTQIQTLTKTRDELLPRLMSGAVRVKGN
jgi:type I restriction enzyme S subunit